MTLLFLGLNVQRRLRELLNLFLTFEGKKWKKNWFKLKKTRWLSKRGKAFRKKWKSIFTRFTFACKFNYCFKHFLKIYANECSAINYYQQIKEKAQYLHLKSLTSVGKLPPPEQFRSSTQQDYVFSFWCLAHYKYSFVSVKKLFRVYLKLNQIVMFSAFHGGSWEKAWRRGSSASSFKINKLNG